MPSSIDVFVCEMIALMSLARFWVIRLYFILKYKIWRVGCVGWFGGCVFFNFVVLVTRWCGGFERRFFLCDLVIHADMLTLLGLDDACRQQSVQGRRGNKVNDVVRVYIRGDKGNDGKCGRGVWWGWR